MRRLLTMMTVAMLSFGVVTAQTRTISGKVTDSKGVPVPGATVKVKNGATVAADNNGDFQIKAQTGDVLTISSIDFGASTVKVGTGSTIAVSMISKENKLSEVVVTTFGVQRQSKDLGYSATSVAAKDLIVAKPISVANGLTGKVAGLQINTTNNGLFAPTRITLRGNRSLSGNNQPLLVVDGAIFYNDINTINPDDIQSVNVLKGSSASAVYGSDASNGVLVITTKRGTRGKSSVTVSSTVQAERLSYMMNLQTQFGSNGGERFVNDFNDLSSYIPYENQNFGPRFNGKEVAIGRPVEDNTVLRVPYAAIKNQKENFFQTGMTYQNSVTFQSGDENGRFYLSAQDLKTTAIMPGDEGHRDVFRIGGARNYGIFSADYSVSYAYKKLSTTNTAEVYQNVMNTPAHVPLTSLSDWQNNKFADLNGFYNDFFDNPYWSIANRRNNTIDNNLTGNLQLSLQATKWLSFSYRAALTNLSSKYTYTQQPRNYSVYARTDTRIPYSNPDGTLTDTVNESPKSNAFQAGAAGVSASYTNNNSSNMLITSDFLASINKQISNDFSLKATLGAAYIDNQITGIYVNAPALILPVFNINNISGTTDLGGTNNNYFREANKLGYFGEAALTYKSWATVHGSYRTDIDSRLSEANKNIPYYDVDAAFVISELIPSIASGRSKVLNFLKIRGAHSITGNISALGGGSPYIADGAYVINKTFTVGSGFPFGSLGGYNQSTLVPNPNLKPETVTENEVGLEMGLFNNRISLGISAYQSDLTDGIVQANTATSAGAFSALLNASNVQNKGYEIELKSTVVKNRDITWNLNANYTYNQNEVKSISGGVQQLALGGANGNAYALVGKPFPAIQTRDWVRDAQGRVIVDAVTGNPTRGSALTYFGQAVPKYILGINTNLTWKFITFNATIDYRGGAKIFNAIGEYTDFTGISAGSALTNRQPFVFPNSVTLDAGKNSVPNTSTITDDGNFNFWPGLYSNTGGNYITSADAWKLREVAIAFALPARLLTASKVIKAASFIIAGRNLVMLRPKSNLWTDPEFSEDTSNAVGRTGTNQAPPTRIFSATLSLTF